MDDKKPMAYRIIVVGHLVYDEIGSPDGKIRNAFGGIAYNLAALSSVMSDGAIIPVCEIGSDRKQEYDSTLGSFPLIDNSLVKLKDLDTVVNRLVYDTHGEREEWNSRIPGQLSLHNMPGKVDALLLNFISGNDVAPNELSDFRKRFDGLIYIDYHSLALGRGAEGKRYLRHNPDWAEYVRFADILQLNLAEFSTIVSKQVSNPMEIPVYCPVLHDSGPKDLVITAGHKGTIISADFGRDAWLIPPSRVNQVVDTTGCGDTLAAVALTDYLACGDIVRSVSEGSRWAACKATFSGIDGFKRIVEIMRNLPSTPSPVKL